MNGKDIMIWGKDNKDGVSENRYCRHPNPVIFFLSILQCKAEQ